MVRRAPQIGQVAIWPLMSICMIVVQPFVLQKKRWPEVARRIRRRAEAC
jgi:hypothetical protein